MMMTTMMWIALKSTVILTGASLAGVMMRRASASLRHLLWTASLSAVLALPLLEASGFRVEVPVPSGWPGTTAAGVGQPRESEPTGVPATPPSVAVTASEARPSNRGVVDAGAADRPARTRAPGPMRPAAVKTASPAASANGHGTAPADPDWSAVLPWIWVLGLALSLVVTVRGHWTAHRLTSRHVRPAAPSAQRRLAALLRDTGIRSRVRLVVSRGLEIPATWGLRRHTIVLPERSAGWTSRRLDRVLVHELAHVRRRDCLAQLVGELARALHWPNPLAWIAVHRLRLEGERAADDEVLSRGDVPSAYAGELVELARALRVGPRVPRAALAMAAGSDLVGRVRLILDPARPRGRVRPATVTLVGLGALVLAFSASAIMPVAQAQERPEPRPQAPLLSVADARAMGRGGFAPPQYGASDPGSPRALSVPTHGATQRPKLTPQQELCVFRPDSERRSTSYHVDGDVQRIRWETDDCSVEIDIDGRIEWAEDDTGIATMAGGAFFQIEERMGRSRTRVRMESDGGRIERRFWVDGESRAWGPEADTWLAQILPQVFRHTTINADARVARMLREGGPDRVFAEVDRMQSEHVARTYLELLMERADLSAAQYARVIDHAAELDSDHSSAELLLSVVERAGLQPEFQDPMLSAAERLRSDHQKTRVLQALLESDLSGAQFDAVLRSAQSIESDHNLGLVLQRVGKEYPLTRDQVDAYLAAAESIESDHQLGTVASLILDRADLTADQLGVVFSIAARIGSDHERAMVLSQVIERRDLSSSEVDRLLQVAEGIGSDHQLASTLMLLVHRTALDEDGVFAVLRLVRGIDSDHNQAEVLVNLADDERVEGEALALYREIAEGLSRYQRNEVLAAIARR